MSGGEAREAGVGGEIVTDIRDLAPPHVRMQRLREIVAREARHHSEKVRGASASAVAGAVASEGAFLMTPIVYSAPQSVEGSTRFKVQDKEKGTSMKKAGRRNG